jgi:hypothetical protein
MTKPPSPTSAPRTATPVHPAAQRALGILLEGHEYAQDLHVSPWEFAVEIAALLAEGCTPNTLRWLVHRGYVEQAVVNAEGAPARREAEGNPEQALADEACFVLTELGASLARAACPPPSRGDSITPSGQGGDSAARETPVWESTQGELRFRGRLVRRFRNAASHQRAILDAFESQGWPERLKDPLPYPENRRINLKRRLRDTIKNLNRDHETRCLHFYAADAGRAVGWQRLG